MRYKNRISSIPDLTMDDIIDNCRKHIPKAYIRCPHRHPELNHGVDLLTSDEGLDCYVVAYGEMHQAKCRAAMQNMPFPPKNSKVSSLSLEIVDWGCGQGIGSICLIDFLKVRNLTQWLKKITLIEPSKFSLNRAVDNVAQSTNNGVRIISLNKYLPSVDGAKDEVRNISFEYNYVFHIFSNILDVAQIDLSKLAKCIEDPGRVHYVLCMGPLNANAFRIDRFSEIFQSQTCFSDISSRNYGHTSDTNYCYTCKTKSFVYDGGGLNLSKYNPNEKAIGPIYEEYNINLQISNGLFSNEKAWIYYRLQNILSSNDLLYLDPNLDGVVTDFIIVRPNVGIIIISLFEGELDKMPKEDKSNETTPNNEDSNKELRSPYQVIEDYHSLIIENIKELVLAIVENNKNLGLVKKVVICTKGSRRDAINTFGEKKYVYIYGSEFVNDKSVSERFFENLRFNQMNPNFDNIILNKFKKCLSPQWHSYREGIDLTLTQIQEKLSKSIEGSERKISGVAGSGKTQVLATRAVNAQVRTGGNVLLLTFNIALVNYMRMRLSQIRADFPWDKIHIDHYHRFFRKHAFVNHKNVRFDSYNDEDFFMNCNLPEYDAILIDEVQDYEDVWLKLLKKYFLRKNGEFVVFGDPKQNIYHRQLDTQGNIRLGVIPGLWNKELCKGQRFSNPALAELAMSFQAKFNENCDTIEKRSSSNFQFNIIKYAKIDNGCEDKYNSVYKLCMDFIRDNGLNIGDVAILAPQLDILRYIDTLYRKKIGKSTTTTFVNSESLSKVKLKKDYHRLENVEKNLFTMDTRNIKISTIQSFKGWEAATVICIIQNDLYEDDNQIMSPELIYTGITRAKENLFIINMDDNEYDEFFEKVIS